MTRALGIPYRAGLWLAMLMVLTTACTGTFYAWNVRTSSTAFAPSSRVADLGQQRIAVLTPLSSPGLRGNESGLGQHFSEVIRKVVPHWQMLDARETASLININGLAGDFVRMRQDAEQSHILDRDVLQKIGTALGVRYVFQPRFASFTQGMVDRWYPLDVRLVQTRASTLRVSLQLWDTATGELLWGSVAEASLQSEAVTQEPVYLEDAERVALASMLADLLNDKRSSNYTPMNHLIDSLVKESVPNGSHKEEPQTDGVGVQSDQGK